MTLSSGRRLGPYEILSPLGAGGMGEVYKARDIRLDRFVAIKVLPSDVASNPERLRRFEQEARAASALNHPNILTIYDVGSADSISYIAMELIEGKTLRDLLLKGSLPVKKLLDLAVQIAEGLASAHEAGIVHRDMKPSNIIVSKDGFAKILDFGLAKLPTPAPKLGSGGSDSVTETVSETEPGILVGTVDYMSPEQALGKEADYRSDQFAFGSILYEMATGKRAFRRGTNLETLAAILHDDPTPARRVRAELPEPFGWLSQRCLAKNASERFVSTRDLARDLQELRDHHSEIHAVALEGLPGGLSRRYAAAVAILSVAALLFATWIVIGRRSPTQNFGPARFSIFPPPRGSFNFDSSSPAPVAISSDGRKLVYGVRDANGKEMLWVRFIEDVEARPLLGTEGATYPFWSPDSRFIGFFAEGKLKKIGSSGGAPQTLTTAKFGRGATWSRDGVILYAPDVEGPLYRIASAGGEATAVTKITNSRIGETHRWPSFFPDGRHFLYTMNDRNKSLATGGIYVGELGTTSSKRVLPDTSNAVYTVSGYVLFARDGVLLAVPFDQSSFKPVGEPSPVADRVAFHPYRWNASFTVARTGSLAYVAGPAVRTSQLVWIDRSGKKLGTVGEPADYGGLRLSPSGDRCAVELGDPRSGTIDIWVLDLERGSAVKLTSGALISDAPTWSPDGSRIAFDSDRRKRWDIYEKSVTGTAPEQVLVESEGDKTPNDWSFDGRLLLFDADGLQGKDEHELWLFDLTRGKAAPYLRPAYDVRHGRFSPDGRWVAYVSFETGRSELYVSPFPNPERKWQVSTAGGSQPVWSRDGHELFYLSSDRRLMAARVATGPTFRVEAIQPVFETGVRASPTNTPVYDVSLDGTRFLVNSTAEGSGPEPITVVLNWTSGFSR